MSSKSYVILGEAKESDSEEEIDLSVSSKNEIHHCKGRIVSGEAPESDEEILGSSNSSETISNINTCQSTFANQKPTKHKSILTKKLYERNESLCKNIHEFVAQAAINAKSELNCTNQKLLKCQIQVQEGADFSRRLNSNLSLLGSILQSLVTMQALPQINI